MKLKISLFISGFLWGVILTMSISTWYMGRYTRSLTEATQLLREDNRALLVADEQLEKAADALRRMDQLLRNCQGIKGM